MGILKSAPVRFRQKKRPSSLTCALLLFVATYCWIEPSPAAEGKKLIDFAHYAVEPGVSGKKQRILPFPKYRSVGLITTLAITPAGGNAEQQFTAQGTIVIPPGKIIDFTPGEICYKTPDIFKKLPLDNVDCLHISASAVEADEISICSRVLAQVGHLKSLLELSLSSSDANDKAVTDAISLFPSLQKLSVVGTPTDGSFLKQIGFLKQLHFINLAHSSVPDEYAQYLATLPDLKYLNIGHSGLSDKGVKQLANCKNLIALNLSGNPRITDESIKSIVALNGLRLLYLGGTSITAAGILRLKSVPLLILELPSAAMLKRAGGEINKSFPRTSVSAPAEVYKHLDLETKTIFAPLH